MDLMTYSNKYINIHNYFFGDAENLIKQINNI